MITLKYKDGTTKALPVKAVPVKPKRVVNLDKRMKINSAGMTVLNPIKEFLMSNPNQSAKDIGAKFGGINFHTIRYHLARAVKFEHLFVTTDNIPLYRVNPAKVFIN